MEGFIGYSALIFMPIYAFGFIMCFAGLLKQLKKDEPISGSAMAAGFFFALMMWTLSSSILLASA